MATFRDVELADWDCFDIISTEFNYGIIYTAASASLTGTITDSVTESDLVRGYTTY